jgi:P27 family predicted phage terminase small subunit
MGERGPAPKPTAIKRAEGVRPDRINEAEPPARPLMRVPEAPEYLDETGREVWERVAPDLVGAGILTSLDLEMFGLLCQSISAARRADELLRRSLVVKGRQDGVVTNPAWRIFRDATNLVRVLSREFGLTPSARSGLRVDVSFHYLSNDVRGATD